MSLQQPHFQEWLDSGVHPDLISLNVKPITGKEVFDDFYPNPDRRNDGRLTDEYLRIFYRYEDVSGWMVDGVNPRTGQPLGRGRFKPTVGEILDKTGKPIKYVSPPGLESPLIYLRVTELIWQRVSERSGIPMPDSYLVNNLTGETPSFWPWVLKNNVPLHPTEGEKRPAVCLRKAMLHLQYQAFGTGGATQRALTVNL